MSVGPGKFIPSSITAGWLFLAGTLTGVAFSVLWAAIAAVVWIRPEKAAAVGVVIAVVMKTLTILVVVLRQLEARTEV